ncbi:outer membrane lipoprotein-sorting protein [Ferruginibacter sp. HRS2-29]|uniref:outer membrane lipoprotein-sorting protein n=1 Tax=Ferruginibacter sp. HRS2-29 TaxID=2487334 RepID=UPI0020CDF032|nr:outer membrane lipoprotein-sorting protein [Ferruginibacter sp. HRS2-29]MCP9751644.1 outer membrane lipoprotein-sorting protein [Ferruginibacter sp. HRS2-29]
MNFFKLLLTTVISFLTINLSAQTVDEIVAKHMDAMGGKEKMLMLKTVKLTGGMSVNGADVSIVGTRSHNIGSRNDIEVMGTSNYEVANNKEGWTFFPIFRMEEPVAMEPSLLTSKQVLFDLQGPFVDYKEKGIAIELKGTEKVEGADTWNLLVTYKNGKTMNYFIDKNTYRVAKTKAAVTANGEEKIEGLLFADYKQNAGGYWFPYSVTNDRGTILYSTIETNIPVDDKVFSK